MASSDKKRGYQKEKMSADKNSCVQNNTACKKNVPSITMESLLFKAQVANVSLINSDDAVVLLEETLLLCFASGLQTLH